MLDDNLLKKRTSAADYLDHKEPLTYFISVVLLCFFSLEFLAAANQPCLYNLIIFRISLDAYIQTANILISSLAERLSTPQRLLIRCINKETSSCEMSSFLCLQPLINYAQVFHYCCRIWRSPQYRIINYYRH